MSESGKNAWYKLHLWQIQVLRDIAVIAAVVGLIQIGYMLRLVTVPILLALLLAYLFEPLIRWMTRGHRVSREGAASIIIAAAILIVIVPVCFGLIFGAVQGVGFIREVAGNAVNVMAYVDAPAKHEDGTPITPETVNLLSEDARKKYQHGQSAMASMSNSSWRTLAETISKNIDTQSPEYASVRDTVINNSQQILKTTIGTGTEALTKILRGVVSIGVLGFTAFLTAFFFFFMSTGYDKVVAFFQRLLHSRTKTRTIELVHKMDNVVAGFVRGRLTICAIQCVVFSIAYFILGVPAAIVLGIGVGIASIVPYLALIGIPIAILLLWLDPPSGFRGEWWWIVGGPPVFYFFAQAFDDYVLTPKIQGKNTGMDAPTVLFASLAGGILAGPYGLLLAIPVAACIKILLIEVIWPRIKAWTEGKAADPLPIAGGTGTKPTSAS